MKVTRYNPRKPDRLPPHRLVLDAMRPGDLKYLTLEELDEREARHRADPEGSSMWPCAACHWHDPAVRKVRAKKDKRLRRFEKTGKLPPIRKPTAGKSRIPKALTDAEAARVVLPRFPKSGKMWVPTVEEIAGDPVARYTALMGGNVDPRAVNWHAYHEWLNATDARIRKAA